LLPDDDVSNSNILSGSTDKTIKVWRTNYTDLVYRRKLIKYKGSIIDLKFLYNGDLATCSSNNSILVWDLDNFRVKSKNFAHNRECLSITVLNNGNLTSSSEDKSIKIWNTDLFYNISNVKGYSNNDNLQ
jgi:WD40 repeat protein